MPNILALLDIDGQTPLEQQTRGNVTQPLSHVDLTYSEDSGEGEGEFIIRNVDASDIALNIEVFTVDYPYEPDSGTQLDQQWAYVDPDTEVVSAYENSINIPELEAGKFVKVRRRVIANADSSTAVHMGSFKVSYLRSSV